MRLTAAERQERSEVRWWVREEKRIALRCFGIFVRLVHAGHWQRAAAHHDEALYLPPSESWPMSRAA